jgi:hypothetical protein
MSWTPPPSWLIQVWNAVDKGIKFDKGRLKSLIPEVGADDGDDVVDEAISLKRAIANTPKELRTDKIYEAFPKLYNKIVTEQKVDTEKLTDEFVNSIQGVDQTVEANDTIGGYPVSTPLSPIQESIGKINDAVNKQNQKHAATLKRNHLDDDIDKAVKNATASTIEKINFDINKLVSKDEELVKPEEPKLKYNPNSYYFGYEFDNPREFDPIPSQFKYENGDVVKVPEGHMLLNKSKKVDPNAQWDGEFLQLKNNSWAPVNDPRKTPVGQDDAQEFSSDIQKDIEDVTIEGVNKEKYNAWKDSAAPGVKQMIDLSDGEVGAAAARYEGDDEKVYGTVGQFLYKNPDVAKELETIMTDPTNAALKETSDGRAKLVKKAVQKTMGLTDEDMKSSLDDMETKYLFEGAKKIQYNNTRIAELEKRIKDTDAKLDAYAQTEFRGTQFGTLLDKRESLSKDISKHEVLTDMNTLNRIANFQKGGATISESDKQALDLLKKKYPGLESDPEKAIKSSQIYNDYQGKVNQYNKLTTKIRIASSSIAKGVAAPIVADRNRLIDEYNGIIKENNEYITRLKDSGLQDKVSKLETLEKYSMKAADVDSRFPTLMYEEDAQRTLNETGDPMGWLKSGIAGVYGAATNVAKAPFEITGGLMEMMFGGEYFTGVKSALNSLTEGEFNKGITPQREGKMGQAIDLVESSMNVAGLALGIMQSGRWLKGYGMKTGQAETLGSFLVAYPSARQRGIQNGLSGKELTAYSFLMSAIEARIEAISPFDNLSESFKNSDDVIDAIKRVAAGNGTKKDIVAALKQMAPAGKGTLMEFGEEVLTDIGQGTAAIAMGNAWGKDLNPDFFGSFNAETMGGVALTSLLMRAGAAGSAGSVGAAESVIREEADKNFHNVWSTIQKVEREYKNKGLDTTYIDLLKNDVLTYTKQEFPKGMTSAQQIALFDADKKIKALEESKNGLNASMRELVDIQIKEIKKAQVDIMNNPDKAQAAIDMQRDGVLQDIARQGFFTNDELSALKTEVQANEEVKDIKTEEPKVPTPQPEVVVPVAQAETQATEIQQPGPADVVPGISEGAEAVQPVDESNPFAKSRKTRKKNTLVGNLTKQLQKGAKKLYGKDIEVSYEDYDAQVDAMSGSEGKKKVLKEKAAGFYNPATNKIYINPKLADPETPVHEFGHLWIEMAKNFRKDVFDKGMSAIKGTEFEQYVRDNYSHLTEEADILDEALAEAIGKRGVELLEDATVSSEVKNFIRDLVDYIKELFSMDKYTTEQILEMNLGEFLSAANAEMFTGEALLGEMNVSEPKSQEDFDSRKDIEKMMYIGEKGGHNMSKEIIGRLAQAKELDATVADNYSQRVVIGEGDLEQRYAIDKSEYIRWSTGWFKSRIDGKWRYEIPLHGPAIKKIREMDASGGTTTLGQILGKESYILKAHPDLIKVGVNFDDSIDGASWSKDRNRIQIGHIQFVPPQILFAHELQHAIQDAEGFPTGSSPEFEKDNLFRDIYNKIKAEDPVAFAKLELAERRRDEAANAGDVEDFDYWAQLFVEIVDSKLKDSGVELSDLDKIALQKYKRSAGEIEARNVEKREDYTIMETSPFNNSLRIRLDNPNFFNDVAPEDAIIRYRDEDGGIRMQLVAPNGKPSKLTPEQHAQVRTPEFKAWFGDWENDPENASKVVDENGEPLVMYHGSPSLDINEFNRGAAERESSGLKELGTYFSTNKTLAEAYATAPLSTEAALAREEEINRLERKLDSVRNNRDYEAITSRIDKLRSKKGKVYEVFLNLRDVKEFDAKGKNGLAAWRELQVDAGYKIANNRDAIEMLKDGKFVDQVDGIIARNIADVSEFVEDPKPYLGTVALVFDNVNGAIKSATDNSGAFNPASNDIRMQLRGTSITQEDILDIENVIKANARDYTPSQIRAMVESAYPELAQIPELLDNIENWIANQNWSTFPKLAAGQSNNPGAPTAADVAAQRESEEGQRSWVKRKLGGDFFKKIRTWLANGFKLGGVGGKDFLIAREKADGFVSSRIRLANHIAQDTAKMLKKLNFTSPTQLSTMQDALGSEDPAVQKQAMSALPVELQSQVVKMREVIDGLSRELVIKGYVDPSQAFTILENEGQYLTRAYRIFEQSTWGKEVLKKDRLKGIFDEAAAFLAKDQYNKLIAAGTPPAEANETATRYGRVEAARILEEERQNSAAKASSGRRDIEILKRREDIPKPIRDLMGEYRDPLTSFMMSVYKLSGLRANSEMLKTVRELGMGKVFFKKDDPARPLDTTQPISGAANDAWSPLNGLYTTPEINSWLKDANGEIEDGVHWAIEAGKTWKKVAGTVRYFKTVASPSTQFKNFLSNSGFAVMNGHFAPWRKGWYDSVAEMGRFWGGNDLSRLAQELEQLDVIDAGFGMQELKEMFGDKGMTKFAQSISEYAIGEGNVAMKGVGKAANWLNKTYAKSDNLWKVYGFMNEATAYSKSLFGKDYYQLTDQERAEVNEIAAEITKNVYPTYSRAYAAIKNFSKNTGLFGNFLTFQAESVRTFGNAWKQGLKELTSGNPAVISIGLRRMGGAMAYAGLRSMATMWVAKKAGLMSKGLFALLPGLFSDEEEEKLRDVYNNIPKFLWDADILVQDNYDGTFTVYDVTSADPYNVIMRTLNVASDSIRENGFGPMILADVIKSVVGDVAEKELSFAAVQEAIDGVDQYGRNIWVNGDPWHTKVAEGLKHWVSKTAPGAVVSFNRLMESDDKTSETIAQLTGVRSYKIDVHRSFSRTVKTAEKDLADTRERMYSILYNPNKTEDEKLTAIDEAREAYKNILKPLHKTYVGNIRLNGDPDRLQERVSGLSRRAINGWTKESIDYILTGDDEIDVLGEVNLEEIEERINNSK